MHLLGYFGVKTMFREFGTEDFGGQRLDDLWKNLESYIDCL